MAAVLDGVANQRGHASQITVDNGTEFYSKAMDQWAWKHHLKRFGVR